MAVVNGNLQVLGQLKNLKPEVLANDPDLGILGSAPRIWVNGNSLKFFNGTEIVDLSEPGVTQTDLEDALSVYASNTQMQNAIDNALSGLDFQEDVIGLETDFVSTSGRYIYVAGAQFTSGVAAAAGDIVEVNAAGEILAVAYDVSVAGPGALVWNRAAEFWMRWNGTNWVEFGGLSNVTAGDGLQKSGDQVSVKLADSSLVVDVNGIKVGDLSGTYATLNAMNTAISSATADFMTATAIGDAIGTATQDLATAASVTAVSDSVTALTSRIEASYFEYAPQAAGTLITVEHNFGNKYPLVQVVDEDDTAMAVDTITFVDANTLTITLAVAGTPRVIVQGLKAAV